MPRLLTKEAITLLEASQAALRLAVLGLAVSQPNTLHPGRPDTAPIVGMLGTSAEQAINACLVQTVGIQSLLRGEGWYRTAAETLADLRKMVRDGDSRLQKLTAGSANSSKVLGDLNHRLAVLEGLPASRAAGLHGGRGITREACLVVADEVADLLASIRACPRARPYIRDVARAPRPSRSPVLLLDEIEAMLQDTEDLTEQSTLLVSAFLIMPAIPDEQPEWLSAIERISVNPTRHDVGFLLSRLSSVKSAYLYNIGQVGESIPASVDRNHPRSVPISPEALKRTISDFSQAFHVQVGLANGSIQDKALNLPTSDMVLKLCELGIDTVLRPSEQNLTAHQAWPYVAASLSMQSTPGPYWFIARRTSDLGQLASMMQGISDIGNSLLRNRVNELLEGIEAIRHDRSTRNSAHVKVIREMVDSLGGVRRTGLARLDRRSVEHGEPDDPLYEMIRRCIEGNSRADKVIDSITIAHTEGVVIEDFRYWMDKLSHLCSTKPDMSALARALRKYPRDSFSPSLRKALRYCDLLRFGPEVDLQSGH